MQKQIQGVETHYEVMGKGEPLILLHGWGCTWEIWYPIMADLSQKFTLILPDLPGFGQSKLLSDDWNSFHYADWLAKFISEIVGEKQFSLAGHSFGGKIAALYAATTPSRLQQLFLIDSAGIPSQLSAAKKFQEKLLGLIGAPLKMFLPARVQEKILERVGADDYMSSSDQQRKIFKHIVKEDISALLPKISAPTTFIWGSNDFDTPLVDGKKMQNLVEGSYFASLETGHFPFIEQPQAFISLMTRNTKAV